jgi:acetamidase/formamidase
MSRHHHLPASPATCHWGQFDAALPPVLTIASGDHVTVDTISGGAEVLPREGFEILADHRAVIAALTPAFGGGHILTGPIAVAGAEPGDVLEVRIRAIAFRQNWGWTRIAPLRGTLPEDFPERRLWHTAIDRQRGIGAVPWGQEIPLAPFFGVMGVAPKPIYGAVTTIIPREFGGNIDLAELTVGATLYLPVWTKGALFSVGDGHGVQGDGEVCLTALETALRKDMRLAMPRAETATHHITLGLDEDLDDAAKQALREMIKLLGERMGLAPADAYMLASLAVNLRVTQLVDGNKGIHAMVAKSLVERKSS